VTLGLVAATARVRVSTARVRMTAAARVSARRGLRMSATTWVRVTAAGVTAWMRGAATWIAVRSTARVTRLIASYRMPTTRAAVVLGATVVLRAGTTAVRYRASMRAAGSMRGNDTSAGELAGSRRRSHSRVAVVKRRAQLSIPGSGVFVITL
jgi:hypothetical protein